MILLNIIYREYYAYETIKPVKTQITDEVINKDIVIKSFLKVLNSE